MEELHIFPVKYLQSKILSDLFKKDMYWSMVKIFPLEKKGLHGI